MTNTAETLVSSPSPKAIAEPVFELIDTSTGETIAVIFRWNNGEVSALVGNGRTAVRSYEGESDKKGVMSLP